MIQIAKNATDLINFRNETLENANLSMTQIKISEQNEWNIDNGIISHQTGGYFNVTGLKSGTINKEHIVLYQPQSAITGLLICKKNKTTYVLLQSRLEPGITGDVQFGPTIQSTAANYMRLHGGRATSNLDMFISLPEKVNLINFSMQYDLGKRYFQKSKSHNYIEIPELTKTDQNMIWIPLEILFNTLSKDYFLNTDLRSLLAVFDWDTFLFGQIDSNINDKIITDFFKIKSAFTHNWKLTPINNLNNWELNDYGVIDQCKSGISVSMYNITCNTREITTWSQPLMETKNQGFVSLFIRLIDGHFEFLLTICEEFGLNEGIGIGPSFLTYPGYDKNQDDKINGKVIYEFNHSDEGGRFIRNDSIYRVYQVDKKYKINENQYWVNTYTLKKILSTSNMATIQLRCICSLLLKELNPLTFSK